MTRAAVRAIATLALSIATVTTFQGCTDTPAPAPASDAAVELGEVIAVVDGDTIDVRTDQGESRVRLIGLDTPEINRSGGNEECYAQEARTELDTMLYGRTVELTTDPSQGDTDRYGRLLRHVTIDGQNAALALIASGAAHEYTYDTPYIGQAEYRDAETEARVGELGLWGACQRSSIYSPP